MRVDYIKSLAEAYVITNQLYKENLTPEEISTSFHMLLKELREEGSGLYYFIDSANKFEQEKIFKTYLDLTFHPEKFIIESYDYEDLESLSEIGPLVAATVGVLIYLTRKPASKAIFRTINAINSFLNDFGKSLATLGKDMQLAYAIIQTNSNKCYDECKFNPKDASYMDYLFQMRKDGLARNIGRIFHSEQDEERLDCLRECYLYSLREIVKLSAHTFFTCLKSTGDISRLPLEREFNAYQLVLTNSGLNKTCDTPLGLFQEAISKFSDALDLIFSEDNNEQRKRKSDLMNEVYRIQKEFSDSASPNANRFQVKSFPKPNKPIQPFNKQNQSSNSGQDRRY